jgi:hypothetical protein
MEYLLIALVMLGSLAVGGLLLLLFAWALVTIERKRAEARFIREGGVLEVERKRQAARQEIRS